MNNFFLWKIILYSIPFIKERRLNRFLLKSRFFLFSSYLYLLMLKLFYISKQSCHNVGNLTDMMTYMVLSFIVWVKIIKAFLDYQQNAYIYLIKMLFSIKIFSLRQIVFTNKTFLFQAFSQILNINVEVRKIIVI